MKSLVATILVASATFVEAAIPLPGGEARAEELQNLRWGMFVCWSLSTFSGKDWTPGATNIDLFHSTGCDTEQWVKTAREAWTNLATGTVLGDKRVIPFDTPVKAQLFRLNVLEASEVPTSSESQLFGDQPSPR